MKATLSFSLPEEREEHELALKGPKLQYAIDELRQWFRWQIDKSDRPESETKILEEARTKLFECLED